MSDLDFIFVQGKGGANHSPDPNYNEYIRQYVESVDADPHYVGDWTLAAKLKGQCGHASALMQRQFPELRMIRGGVMSTTFVDPSSLSAEDLQEFIDCGDGHIWLETADGLIVDPTAQQFRDISKCYYIAFNEANADKLPTGKCPNCGDYVYANSDAGGCCSMACFNSYAAYLGVRVSR